MGGRKTEHAIVITRFEQQIVKDRIHDAGVVVAGASRDRPPIGSLGELLKQHDSSPQILSYFSAILVREGFVAHATMELPQMWRIPGPHRLVALCTGRVRCPLLSLAVSARRRGRVSFI
jgi:hypothetical protein